MTVCFLPAGTVKVASSRIRVYAVLSALERLGVETCVGYRAGTDVLVVQKRVDAEIVAMARAFRKQGGRVFYDCDDLGRALEYWAPEGLRRELIPLAEAITTNTPEYAETLARLYGKRVAVIPDVVDYGLTAPVAEAPAASGDELRVLWFGNGANLRLLEPYVEIFQTGAGCSLTVCSGRELPGVGFVRWTLEGFPAVLRSFDLTFLPHGDKKADRAKSNNRMITSIAWGVPAVVSRTPAYERTARAAGVEGACFGGPEEARGCLERWRSRGAREGYLRAAQAAIWREHSPEAVARLWRAALKE